MQKRVLTLLAVSLLGLALVSGCGSSEKKKASTPQNKVIKIGATAGPHADVVHAVADEAKKQGINVEVVEFSDYITPDKALAEGDLDLNSYQHAPFLANFAKQNNTKLVPIGNTILMRMGIYSNKIHDINAVPDGSVVAIPNDPTNGGRGLVLLEKAGLIKLKEGVGFKATAADVAENPKHLKFKELEAAQLPRSLDDVDLAVITMNYVMSSGMDVKKQGLFWEKDDEPLAIMVLAAREKDKDNPTYKKIADLFHSDAVKKFIGEKFKGTIIPAKECKKTDQKDYSFWSVLFVVGEGPLAHFCCTFFLQPADGFLIGPASTIPLEKVWGTLQGIIIGSDPAKERPLFMNETQMSLFIIMAEHAIAAIQGGSFRDGVHTFKEKAKFTAGKGHDFLQS